MEDEAEFDYAAYVQELSSTLKRLRKERGLAQEALAHAAGLAAYTYQKFERGQSRPHTPMNPRLRTLVALSAALGIEVAELLPSVLASMSPVDDGVRPAYGPDAVVTTRLPRH